MTPPAPAIENAKIIVVEDESLLRDHLEKAFEFFLNRKVLGFKNAQEALEHINKNRVDLVLSDVDMPAPEGASVKNGLELLKWTKKNYPDIIFITMSGGDYEKEAKFLGAKRFIKKPFGIAPLIQLVSKYISGD